MEMQRVLGVDVGEARVGLALSDELGMLAHPLETITVAKCPPVARVAELVQSRGVGTVVVGVARNMDGSRGDSARRGLDFIAELASRVGCPVIAWDERLSTVQAQRALREAGRSARKQRAVIDQAAAQIILQSWLDSRPCA
jgi:putative holliday junction resolvase